MVDAVDVSEMNTLEEQDESGEPKALPQLDINTLLKKKSPIVRSHQAGPIVSRDGCTVGRFGQWLIKDANHTNAELTRQHLKDDQQRRADGGACSLVVAGSVACVAVVALLVLGV